ncbi:23S rRNA m(5)U-1939 methyltransferase [Cribrihabitans marinus]|uniref:23S rRNA m(5)U-1939 methyltransferase n=1 Tax=Cribrihabitans marinus TaxID=1227549 RepID=A0A1H6YG36_9RHOB|nr:class I SAM-dependent RNA methyltransferase [Cribrihabitans marinus]GGH28955.1 RNA methyltransferase [Cribrihabitans marinus]SEJ38824.1 23S rRNA m(5)U-1939 methyltransferase [Cribrihabitans marinus]
MRQTVTIERLGHQGDGVAAGPLFAPRCLPGEVVSGIADGDRLRDIRVEAPSGDRVAAPCRHYKSCGGCQLQHASDGFVAGWKVDVVRAALAAQGVETAFRPILTSPPRSRRRATLSARRTKKGALAGFHGRASDVIVEIPDCHLLDPALMAALPAAEALAVLGGSRKGELSVAATLSAAGLDVAVSGGKPLHGPLELSLAQACERLGLARLAWDGEVIAMRAPPVQRFGRAEVVPPPGAFLQATAHGEAALLAAVREILGEAGRVADLFAGCGTFSLPLAERAEVHAVEGAAEMTDALDKGWRGAEGLKRVTTEFRDLFRRPLLADELARFDAVVLDPPRAGAEAQVTELARSRVPVIAYVSCNPVSFARDARTLTGAGYALDWVQVVDQFRWSPHVELAARFTATHMGGSRAGA